MYLSVDTRPDITFAVNKASQYLEKSNKIRWNTVKRIFKYLKGTTKHGIYFSTEQNNHIKAFSDADYAGDIERKSITSFILKLGDSAIAWGSIRQRTVALSTTEAEYITASQTVKKIIWMKNLINDLAMFKNLTTTWITWAQSNLLKILNFIEKINILMYTIISYEEFLLQHIASEDQQTFWRNPEKNSIWDTKKSIEYQEYRRRRHIKLWHSNIINIYTLNKFQFTFSGSVIEFKVHWNFICGFIIQCC